MLWYEITASLPCWSESSENDWLSCECSMGLSSYIGVSHRLWFLKVVCSVPNKGVCSLLDI